jgi:hypothetical protein
LAQQLLGVLIQGRVSLDHRFAGVDRVALDQHHHLAALALHRVVDDGRRFGRRQVNFSVLLAFVNLFRLVQQVRGQMLLLFVVG